MSDLSLPARRSAFTTAAPAISTERIEDIVLRTYGIDADATMLASERDLTVRLDARDGARFVLKIANAAEDPQAAEFQNRAMSHIAQSAPEVPVSRLVPTLEGKSEFFVEADSERHFTRLLTWLPGRPLYGTSPSATQTRAVGEALGRLARGLADFDHPASDHTIVWDMRHAPRLLALTQHIADHLLRGKVERILAYFRDEIAPRQDELRWQVVHNDFNPFNLLVDDENNDRLTGIIDFGDVVRTPTIYDLGVACSYHVVADGHPLRLAATLAAAYHAIHPAPSTELELLFDLMATRHAMTIAIAEWRASQYPENAPYIRRNCARATAALLRCEMLSREDATLVFRESCAI